MTTVSDTARSWLDRLVAFDTTSRDSNRPLLDAVAEHARELGLEPQLFPAPGTEDDPAGKANMVVTIPDAEGRTAGGVLLAGHTDCVPVDGQQWASDPFTVTERDGRLYGRGTADMKGFLACCLAALPALLERPLREPVHLGFTYDEEVGCVGAQPFVDALAAAGLTPRIGFVGEPSMMRMIRGHKSINVVHITLTGVPAHSSLTDQGVNAIEYGAEIVRYWRDRADAWKAEGPFDDAYPLAYTSASVNQITGGNAVNTVPETCRVSLEFRALAAVSDAEVIDELKAFCADVEQRMQAENPKAKVEVEVAASTIGLDIAEDADVVAYGQTLGLEVTGEKVTYGTEAGVYTAGGTPCVVCGPGDIGVAHKPDEFVEPEQLAACEAFLARLIDDLRA